MEIIRKETDYAVRAILALFSAGPRWLSCAEVSKACGISTSFAYKILRELVKARMVASHTGRTGGFSLSEDLGRISLGRLARAIQGPIILSRCVMSRDACERKPTCPLSAKWGKLQRGIMDFLEGTTLRDLLAAEGGPDGADAAGNGFARDSNDSS